MDGILQLLFLFFNQRTEIFKYPLTPGKTCKQVHLDNDDVPRYSTENYQSEKPFIANKYSILIGQGGAY